jgi:hypothetical protein
LNYTDIMPFLIFFCLLFIGGGIGLWYVRKTTGRSMRDMLAVLGAGVTFILLMGASSVFFRPWLKSPDRHTRRVAEDIVVGPSRSSQSRFLGSSTGLPNNDHTAGRRHAMKCSRRLLAFLRVSAVRISSAFFLFPIAPFAFFSHNAE